MLKQVPDLVSPVVPRRATAAVDRALNQFGLERESGGRFGLWVMRHASGSAPDPVVAFKDLVERKAAEDYAWAAERVGRS